MSKKTKIILLLIIISSIVLLLIGILLNINYSNKNNKNNIENVYKEHCYENICLTIKKISYESYEGEIEYSILNKDNTNILGSLELEFEKTVLTFNYDFTNGNNYEGIYKFSGSDLSVNNEYKIIGGNVND